MQAAAWDPHMPHFSVDLVSNLDLVSMFLPFVIKLFVTSANCLHAYVNCTIEFGLEVPCRKISSFPFLCKPH
jgi:hypothetical protein